MWHPVEQCLYWVDILAKQVHRFDPALTAHQYFQFDKMPGAVVPIHSSEDLMISFEDGVARFNTHTHDLTYLIQYHQNQPDMRANDGKCDAFGNFWIGTMSKTAQANAGNLYCLTPDLDFNVKIANTTIANGLAWSHDHRTMYFIDSTLDSIRSFDYEASSQNITSEKIVIHDPEKRYFDGMTLDTEGMLWVAHCGDGCIRRWDPATGQVLLKIDFPCPIVTSLTFGGKDHKTLYISTSQENMSLADREKYPSSGAIFYIETAYQGYETQVFGLPKNT